MQQIRFVDPDASRQQFFATLRKRVDAYFRENNLSKHHTPQMVIKTIILISLYVLPFFLILLNRTSTGINFLLWSLMGAAMAGIGMSVMHDANHGAYSAKSSANYWLGHTLNLLGGSVFNWKLQHNMLHHTYTNVLDMDDDIDDKLILRFSPHTEVKWYHRFQYLYAFLFYGILTLYWVVAKDFVQHFGYIKRGVNKDSKEKNRKVFFKVLTAKVVYAVVFFVLPLAVLKLPLAPYVIGFLLMHFVAGIILTVIFQLAHTVEDTTHPLPDELGTIENAWAIHQLNTTVNFSRKCKFLTWYLGGLNYQIEHHLFPTICHVHYPAIAPIVKQTAEEYGIAYLENEDFLSALNSHVQLLKKFGQKQTPVPASSAQ